MKIFAKFTDKLRKLGKKGKFLVCSAMATIGAATMSVCSFAAETEGATGLDMNAVLQEAGTSLQNSFEGLVKTMIPVLLGIAGSSIVIFAVMALFKFGRKIFGKVAG